MMINFWKDPFDYRNGHKARWMRAGSDFFAELVKMIDQAENLIHFQVYIISPDKTGNLLIESLIRAARRGVEVYLVVDDFGADEFGENETNQLKEAGVNVKRFEPFISSGKFYVGRRMHHKVLVVDERVAMVGGINIADRYRGTATEPAWLDYGVFIEGTVCKELNRACVRILERQFIPSPPKWPRINTRGKSLDASKDVWVRIRKNDWLRNRREITASYNKAIKLSKESVLIVGGYFIPGRKFRRLLGSAARRGVDIRIIMTHFSDVPVVKYASDYLYGWLLRHKIKIYESKNSMVHGKVAIVDKTWSTIGSYNQNHLSAYLSIELNIDVVNNEFSSLFHQHLMDVITTECTEVTSENYYQKSSVFAKLRRWGSYQLVRLSLRLLFVINRIFKIDD